MGLSQRVVHRRVSRETMKYIIAAVLIAYVTADGSMPTVGEVEVIPEMEMVQDHTLDGALMSRKPLLGGLPKGAAADVQSALNDRVGNISSETTAAMTMSARNLATVSEGGEASAVAEQSAAGGVVSNYVSGDGAKGIGNGESIMTGGNVYSGAVRGNYLSEMVSGGQNKAALKSISNLEKIPDDD